MESFILMPLATVSMPFSGLPNTTLHLANTVSTPQVVLLQKLNNDTDGFMALNQAIDPEVQINNIQAEAIDAYFHKYDMPLEGMGMKMVEAAKLNGLDWRLLPAISVRESTGGKFACKKVTYSFLGWGSCKINFTSNEQSIDIVAHNLGGNNPKTAQHYDKKTTEGILRSYNPPSIIPNYVPQVIKIMDAIGDKDLGIVINS